ncbi:hypothetical protein PFX98_01670 [Paucibacter sediminis]|uniref:Uncharacterized protein n=1 Tax=Paucibacter sediminis TaxID=3019553 RepID=A0AA95NDV2_9BURK|nr:hypothetical protein [Paucibacter sp. S2-9]WIT12340.1 hypothetical protein PFX98_01670 [Paucibacter sp. S2-9]
MNSMFLSAGSDPYAHLLQHAAAVPTAAFEGTWATIELQPDPFARQQFTVGVAVASMDGSFSFRLLDDLAKFECLYGRDDVAEIRALVDAAEHGLLRAQKSKVALKDVPFETGAVFLGDLWTTSGASIDAVINRLYFDVVPFIPRDERKTRDFVSLDNAAVRRLVNDELKRIAGLAYERIATEPERAVKDQNTGEAHWLEFNLEPEGKAGNVISAVYKTPNTIELNFLRASRDLSTYAKLKKLSDQQLGLFIMMPAKDSMPAIDFDRVENILGEQSWSLEQQGFRVAAHDSAVPLAQEVWEWAGVPV